MMVKLAQSFCHVESMFILWPWQKLYFFGGISSVPLYRSSLLHYSSPCLLCTTAAICPQGSLLSSGLRSVILAPVLESVYLMIMSELSGSLRLLSFLEKGPEPDLPESSDSRSSLEERFPMLKIMMRNLWEMILIQEEKSDGLVLVDEWVKVVVLSESSWGSQPAQRGEVEA